MTQAGDGQLDSSSVRPQRPPSKIEHYLQRIRTIALRFHCDIAYCVRVSSIAFYLPPAYACVALHTSDVILLIHPDADAE
jgi:hypothetical protein